MNRQARIQGHQDSPVVTPFVSGVLQRKCACGNHTVAREQCTECANKKDAPQRYPSNQSEPTEAPAVVHDVLRSPGQPLGAETRAFMETRFGKDFSQVRVHADARAAESAQAVNAVAYTVGRDVVFGAGQYAAGTDMGNQLLAHELTHTLQQDSGTTGHLQISSPTAPHEEEANRVASTIKDSGLAGRFSPAVRTGQQLHRQMIPVQDSPVPLAGPYTGYKPFPASPPVPAPPVQTKKAPAPIKPSECEEFPGGSTDCEVDETGTPTGKVTHRIDETNPCTRPCVEQHEAIHVKQMKTFCPELRDCYLAADKGKRPVSECFKMAIFGSKERECEAYKVSVPCVERRLKDAKECQSKENKEYGTRKLASEKCFRSKSCSSPGGK